MAEQMDGNLEDIRRLDKSQGVENNYEETHIPDELRKDIEAVLNLFVRPQISAHDGGVEVLYLDDDGILWIEMQGECAGCPSADETAKDLVEKELTARLPQIKGVEIDTGISFEVIENAMKLMSSGKN